MKAILASIDSEYKRYKVIADAAMNQLSEAELSKSGPNGGNSVAVVAWHIAGNLSSRFTNFLTTDGEKPWRNRETEFEARTPSRQELLDHWEKGWRILFESLSELTDEHLQESITIRGVELSVNDALHRSLAHTSYHVGQIVYIAKTLRGADWEFLSIPPGGTEAYNQNPTSESADAHLSKLKDSLGK